MDADGTLGTELNTGVAVRGAGKNNWIWLETGIVAEFPAVMTAELTTASVLLGQYVVGPADRFIEAT
jgi:hypothetical protein